MEPLPPHPELLDEEPMTGVLNEAVACAEQHAARHSDMRFNEFNADEPESYLSRAYHLHRAFEREATIDLPERPGYEYAIIAVSPAASVYSSADVVLRVHHHAQLEKGADKEILTAYNVRRFGGRLILKANVRDMTEHNIWKRSREQQELSVVERVAGLRMAMLSNALFRAHEQGLDKSGLQEAQDLLSILREGQLRNPN